MIYNRTLVLVGMPGSGKSTLGRILANSLMMPFADLDALLEAEEGCSIAQVFAQRGEGYFRQRESELLLQVLRHPAPMVLATGGGTPCYYDNMRLIRKYAASFYLEVPWHALAQRLQQDGGQRPLLDGLQEGDFAQALQEKFSWRLPFYRQAHYCLPVQEYASTEEMIEHIHQLLLADQ